MKIFLSEEQVELFKTIGEVIVDGNKTSYYHFPFFIKPVGKHFELIQFKDLPPELANTLANKPSNDIGTYNVQMLCTTCNHMGTAGMKVEDGGVAKMLSCGHTVYLYEVAQRIPEYRKKVESDGMMEIYMDTFTKRKPCTISDEDFMELIRKR